MSYLTPHSTLDPAAVDPDVKNDPVDEPVRTEPLPGEDLDDAS